MTALTRNELLRHAIVNLSFVFDQRGSIVGDASTVPKISEAASGGVRRV